MKKVFFCAAFAMIASTSFAGNLKFTTSCGDTYQVEYPDYMSTHELMNRLFLLDAALC